MTTLWENWSRPLSKLAPISQAQQSQKGYMKINSMGRSPWTSSISPGSAVTKVCGDRILFISRWPKPMIDLVSCRSVAFQLEKIDTCSVSAMNQMWLFTIQLRLFCSIFTQWDHNKSNDVTSNFILLSCNCLNNPTCALPFLLSVFCTASLLTDKYLGKVPTKLTYISCM